MIGLRIYLALGAVAAAVALVVWLRVDAANDREKQLRDAATRGVMIDIREDQASDNDVDKKSDDDLRRELNRWLRQ